MTITRKTVGKGLTKRVQNTLGSMNPSKPTSKQDADDNAKGAPKIISGLPEDRYLRSFCKFFLANPDLEPFPEFVRPLMEWYLANVPEAKLSGRDVAALVDYFSTDCPVRQTVREMVQSSQDTKRVYSDFNIVRELIPKLRRSEDAISKAHVRYGKKAAQRKIEQERFKAVLEDLLRQVKASRN